MCKSICNPDNETISRIKRDTYGVFKGLKWKKLHYYTNSYTIIMDFWLTYAVLKDCIGNFFEIIINF